MKKNISRLTRKSKSRLPRKMKKAMNGLLIIPEDGKVIYNWRFNLRRYPRTRWVVRAEREFRRLWREDQEKTRKLAAGLEWLRILKADKAISELMSHGLNKFVKEINEIRDYGHQPADEGKGDYQQSCRAASH